MPKSPSKPSPDWRRAILQYIADHPDRPMKRRALAREIDVPHDQYQQFKAILDDMLAHTELVLGPGRTLALPRPEAEPAILGVLHLDERGFGFIDRPGQPSVFVPPGSTGGAAHGDTVTGRLIESGRRGDDRARVVKVVKKAEVRWVGELVQRGHRWFIHPQGAGPVNVVEVDDPGAKNAKPGDLVVVEPLGTSDATGRARGVIIERLGHPSEFETQVRGIIRRLGIPDEFPPEVLGEARSAAGMLSQDEINRRENLRGRTTITIDPVNARDFDDAITLERLRGGGFELGVHIADVAFFIPRAGALDEEARLRGNSVYFPGVVVPMLPEVLSNGVCSLQEGQPRLTKSAFITYDAQANVVSTRFANTVIQSTRRFTYEQVTALLEQGPNAAKWRSERQGRDAGSAAPHSQKRRAIIEPVDSPELPTEPVDLALAGGTITEPADLPKDLPREVVRLLHDADDLARRIRERRLRNGMIVLHLPEVEIRLDDDGRPVDAGPADTSFSHTIIEMFMVEANEAVCRLLTRLDLPHLRRVHPAPEPTAVQRLAAQLMAMGHSPPHSMEHAEIQRLLASVRGQPDEPAVNYLLLRSMSQAAYSPQRQGHYALASKDYTHFTSPIRRYPDLTIHRLLDLHLTGRLEEAGVSRAEPDASLEHGRERSERVGGRRSRKTRRREEGSAVPSARRRTIHAELESDAELVRLGFQTSTTERRAQEAERDARTLLMIELMKDKVGEAFDGLVWGISKDGVWVRILPFMAEGLIRMGDIDAFTGQAEPWQHSRETGALVGRKTGRIIMIGQRVRVRVASVNEFRQEIELVPESRLGVARRGAAASGEGVSSRHRRGSERLQQARGRHGRVPRGRSERARRSGRGRR